MGSEICTECGDEVIYVVRADSTSDKVMSKGWFWIIQGDEWSYNSTHTELTLFCFEQMFE